MKVESINDGKEYSSTIQGLNAELLRHSILGNQNEIILVSETVLRLIPEGKERLRGDNQLSSSEKEKLIQDLELVEEPVSDLGSLLPKDRDTDTEKEVAAVLNWTEQFKSALQANLANVSKPENLANATVPVAIILSCGALCGLVGGPMGFGAGSVLGHLVKGQIKPGAAAKSIEDNVQADVSKE